MSTFANAHTLVFDIFKEGIKPLEALTVSEWADKYRILPRKTSAEAGRWRTSRTPYLKEIMDELSHDNTVKRVVLKKGSQTGGTEAGNNWIGYTIDHDPCTMMVVWPSLPDVKKNSSLRIDPLIEGTPCLRSKVGGGDGKRKDEGNTRTFKSFEDGALILTGANSASGLRSIPAKKTFLDEIDAYPLDVEGEGDPVALVAVRSRTFSRSKMFLVSSPTYKGISKIDKEFKLSDQRYYYCPCPHCDHYQIIGHEDSEKPLEVFDYLKYETIDTLDAKKVISAYLFCKKCGEEIKEFNKTKMLEKGKWIKHNPQSDVSGFHLSAMYSPLGWYSWKELCQDYENALFTRKEEDMKVFINTALGEVFESKGDKPEHEKLFSRREDYEIGVVPNGPIFLTCSVDVQEDRLESEVIGWARKLERWSIERFIFYGDTASDLVWNELGEYICKSFPTVNGHEIGLKMVLIDSGYRTQKVYSFCRKFNSRFVRPIKGSANLDQIVASPKSVDLKSSGKIEKRRGMNLWRVGVNIIKSEIYGDLKKEINIENIGDDFPPGFIHFPKHDMEYFQQLTAEERKLSKDKKGFPVIEWIKKRERNETLDLHVYNRAAASMLGIDKMKEEGWQRLESQIVFAKKVIKTENERESIIVKRKRRKSGFL